MLDKTNIHIRDSIKMYYMYLLLRTFLLFHVVNEMTDINGVIGHDTEL